MSKTPGEGLFGIPTPKAVEEGYRFVLSTWRKRKLDGLRGKLQHSHIHEFRKVSPPLSLNEWEDDLKERYPTKDHFFRDYA